MPKRRTGAIAQKGQRENRRRKTCIAVIRRSADVQTTGSGAHGGEDKLEERSRVDGTRITDLEMEKQSEVVRSGAIGASNR